MAPASKKELALKEKHLFKELLALYESRQLKKGVKTADQILKKFPDNGETLCMKGLILTHMGKREEGLELVKKGIRLDLTSHICWHVFGLIQKGEKNYEEALKSYTQALRFDKDNLNLLLDAANLQTQLRLYDSLQDTRENILKTRPTQRRNWIALAVAYHLNGNLPEARNILENYERILKNVPDYDFEHSEEMLYHVRVLEELGEYSAALSFLDQNAKARVIVDRTAVMEARARLSSKLENAHEADSAWRALIEKNPECYEYYRGFFKQKGVDLDEVSEDQRHTVINCLQESADQHRRATTPLRLALAVASGEEFKQRAREYIHNGIIRGIPSIFSDVKGLYTDVAKQEAIEEIVEDFKNTYAAERSTYTANGHATPDSDSEPPTTYLWVLYFLAQHHSHLGRYPLALSIIDAALAHTPTLPELHLTRARLLKRAGDPTGAVKAVEEARRLDGQDRFLNTKSAKYLIRAGRVEEAQAILGLFTKKDALSPAADLEEMQSLLYLMEEADTQNRLGKLGHALKKYLAVQKVFDDIYNDQYDFHTYSIRRSTVNIYINLLLWEDRLRYDPAFVKSALEVARIYVRVYDEPALATAASSNAGLTDAEKKAQKKAKKAAAKNQEDAKKAAANAASANEDKGLEPPTPKDEDLDGLKALTAKDGLEQAWKLLKPLASDQIKNVDICVALYDVSVRRQKYVQASKALLQAHSLDEQHPELHVRVVDFKQRVSSLPKPPAGPVNVVLTSALDTLLPTELALETFNSQYLQRHSTSPLAILAAARVLVKLSSPKDEVEGAVFSLLAPEVKLGIKSALSTLQFLSDIRSPRREEFRLACDKRFELATVFKSPEELAQLQTQVDLTSNGVEPTENKA